MFPNSLSMFYIGLVFFSYWMDGKLLIPVKFKPMWHNKAEKMLLRGMQKLSEINIDKSLKKSFAFNYVEKLL